LRSIGVQVDYDVGDLIVAVQDSEMFPELIRKGQVYTCLELRDGSYRLGGEKVDGPVVLVEVKSPTTGYWAAFLFRKLPKKSLEFFVGETQEIEDMESV
jgi:hypothetical protein